MRHGFIDHGRERAIAEEWIRRLRIRTPSASQVCRNLSGGNQQKIVIARWLTAHSHILILDHPTCGLDVGAKEEVYDMIRNLSAEGVAIVLTSDTLEETIGISHTILVMRAGRLRLASMRRRTRSRRKSRCWSIWCERRGRMGETAGRNP